MPVIKTLPNLKPANYNRCESVLFQVDNNGNILSTIKIQNYLEY